MTLTEQFKQECDQVIKAWRNLIAMNKVVISNPDLDEANRRVLAGKDAILNQTFLTSFKNVRNEEEQRYFFKILQSEFDVGKDDNSIYQTIYFCQSITYEKTYSGRLVYNMYELQRQFLSRIDFDKWTTPEQLATAQGDLKARTEELKTANESITSKDKEFKDYAKEAMATIRERNEEIEKLKTDKIALEAEKEQLKKDLADKEHTIKDKEKIIDDNKDLPDKVKELNKQLSDKDLELTSRNDTIKTLTTEKATAEQELNNFQPVKDFWDTYFKKVFGEFNVAGLRGIGTQLDKLKSMENTTTEYETKWQKLYDYWEKEFRDYFRYSPINLEAMELVKNKLIQNQSYLTKLLANYKEEITKITKRFYLNDLGIDESSDINPAYYNPNYFNLTKEEKETTDEPRSYLELLKDLKGESEPEQIIDAFKLVALICATEKAQADSDKWINKPIAKKPQIKEPKLKTFKSVLKFWNLNIDLSPTEINNPLYLPIINQKQDYINKMNEIIKLWQKL